MVQPLPHEQEAKKKQGIPSESVVLSFAPMQWLTDASIGFVYSLLEHTGRFLKSSQEIYVLYRILYLHNIYMLMHSLVLQQI